MSNEQWLVARIRSNFDIKARRYLERQHIPCYLPVLCRTGHRQQRIEEPLFSGYIFFVASYYQSHRIPIKRMPGFVNVLSREGQPDPVDGSIIENLQLVLKDGDQPSAYPYLQVGKQVEVRNGALKGAYGFIVGIDQKKALLVISIHILGRSVAVHINPGDVRPAT